MLAPSAKGRLYWAAMTDRGRRSMCWLTMISGPPTVIPAIASSGVVKSSVTSRSASMVEWNSRQQG